MKSYLLSLCAAALLGALAMSLLPDGGIKKTLRLCCALLLALAAIRPIAEIDEETLAESLSRLRMQAETLRTGVEVKNRELVAEIIKQKAETYILDKASSLGLRIEAEVTVEEETSYPYPAAVTLTGWAETWQKSELGAYITQTLAIPKESQIWKTNEAAQAAD